MTAEKKLHSSLKVTFYLCFIICSSPADHSSRCCNPTAACEPNGRGTNYRRWEASKYDGSFLSLHLPPGSSLRFFIIFFFFAVLGLRPVDLDGL